MGKGANASKNDRARKDAAKRKDRAAGTAGSGGTDGIAKRQATKGYVCKHCMVRAGRQR